MTRLPKSNLSFISQAVRMAIGLLCITALVFADEPASSTPSDDSSQHSAKVKLDPSTTDETELLQTGQHRIHEDPLNVARKPKDTAPLARKDFATIIQRAEKQNHALLPVLKLAVEAIETIERDVRDYTCLLVKRERIKGKLTDYQYLNLKIRHAQRTEKAQTVPFSVYVKFLSPARYLDREVLFVEGRHHNDLIAKRGGRRNPNLTLRLDTTGPLAMEGNLYPITEIGFQNLAKQLVEVMEAELDVKGGQVEVFENAKLNGRSCRRYKVTHVEKRDGLRFHVAEVLVDKELRFPVYYASYGWPTDPDGKPRLLEQYFYTKIDLNVGLTDDDFRTVNPKYGFRDFDTVKPIKNPEGSTESPAAESDNGNS